MLIRLECCHSCYPEMTVRSRTNERKWSIECGFSNRADLFCAPPPVHSGPQCRLNPDFPRGRRGCLSSVLFTPGNLLFTNCICRQPACEELLIKCEIGEFQKTEFNLVIFLLTSGGILWLLSWTCGGRKGQEFTQILTNTGFSCGFRPCTCGTVLCGRTWRNEVAVIQIRERSSTQRHEQS